MKNTVKRILIASVCLGLCALFVLFVQKLPEYVSYTQADDTPVLKAQNVKNENTSVKYKSLGEITQQPPFVIRSEGQEIFVLKDSVALYKIDVNPKEFPKGDIDAIEGGIVAESKDELFELVSFLES